MPKISIVSAYYNRRESLWRTLKSIEKSSVTDFEYIVVDDASDLSQRIEDFEKEFNFLKVVRIEPKDKHHINPCIPFNLGFSMVKGDLVIIQAPECMHVGDVLDFVVNNSKNNQYLVFSCYGLGKVISDKLNTTDFTESSIINTIGKFHPRSTIDVGKEDSWIIHPVYRAKPYNFLTSMTTNDLLDLGGFDEHFANGHSFDDTEFAARISKKGMDIKFINKPMCIHQYHSFAGAGIVDISFKEAKNKKLYKESLKSTNYKIKNSFI